MCLPPPSQETLGAAGLGLKIGGTVTSAIGAYQSSKASKAAFEYQAAVQRNNAMLDEYAARDATFRGQLATASQRLKTAATKGSQRARLAARGVALDEGSALNILADTDFIGGLDAATISDNAAREAYALRQSAGGRLDNAQLLSARAKAESPFGAAAGTLLGGATQVASSWYRLREEGVFDKKPDYSRIDMGV